MEEEKVRALGKMGYDMDFNSEAYNTVSGKNGNNSVRLYDETMKIMNLDEDPCRYNFKDGATHVNKDLKVKALDAINESLPCGPRFNSTTDSTNGTPALPGRR